MREDRRLALILASFALIAFALLLSWGSAQGQPCPPGEPGCIEVTETATVIIPTQPPSQGTPVPPGGPGPGPNPSPPPETPEPPPKPGEYREVPFELSCGEVYGGVAIGPWWD